MRQPKNSLLGTLVAFTFVVALTPTPNVLTQTTLAEEIVRADGKRLDDLIRTEKQVFFFQAKYSRALGPCIEFANGHAMLMIDAFEVIHVHSGNLNAKTIHVRPMSQGGPGYPQNLAEGGTYVLQLTPSENTKQQLRESQSDGSTFLWVNGDEVKELRTAK